MPLVAGLSPSFDLLRASRCLFVLYNEGQFIDPFIMGLAFVYLASQYEERGMLFVMMGILSGFTTFSAFLFDGLKLWDAEKSLFSFGYLTTSVVSLLVVFVADGAAIRVAFR